MGEKVLELDPNNYIGLTLTAAAMADTLSDCDSDRDVKILKIRQRASRVLATLELVAYPPSATPEQISGFYERGCQEKTSP